MRNYILLGAFAALALPWTAAAQAGASIHVVTNGHAIVKTIIVTNGGSVSISSSSFGGGPGTAARIQPTAGATGPEMIDPHALLKALTGRAGAGAPVSTNPVTWLGMSADEVSEELRAHLPLPEGAGLVVRDVAEGGPASGAGLQANDVIIRLDDQLLFNSAQLQSLVRARKSGEEATLTVLRKGQEKKIKATLGQKVPTAADSGAPQVVDLGSFDLDMGKVFGQLGSNGGPVVFQRSFTTGSTNLIDPAELQKNVQQAINEAMKQMRREMEKAGFQPPAAGKNP